MINDNLLSRFISIERGKYEGIDNNRFSLSLGQAQRYYKFIQFIFQRYKEVSCEFISNTQIMHSLFQGGNGKLSEEQYVHLMENRRLSTLVHLEIETFYLFAKVLLDKIAHFFQDYFGQARGVSLKSHDKLTKNYKKFCLAKEIVLPEGFSKRLIWLKEHVSDYRDKQISHLQNPRTIKATTFKLDQDETRIASTQLYPNEWNCEKPQVESYELSEIMQAIDLYIEQIIEIISTNRNKTRFRLKN